MAKKRNKMIRKRTRDMIEMQALEGIDEPDGANITKIANVCEVNYNLAKEIVAELVRRKLVKRLLDGTYTTTHIGIEKLKQNEMTEAERILVIEMARKMTKETTRDGIIEKLEQMKTIFGDDGNEPGTER